MPIYMHKTCVDTLSPEIVAIGLVRCQVRVPTAKPGPRTCN